MAPPSDAPTVRSAFVISYASSTSRPSQIGGVGVRRAAARRAPTGAAGSRRGATKRRGAGRVVGTRRAAATRSSASARAVAGGPLAEALDAADRLVEGAQAERREQLAHFLRDVQHVGGDALGRSGELRPQVRALGRDAGRAGVAVARADHDAALGEHRRGAERVLVGAEQRREQHVASGLEAAVDAHPHAVAQAFLDQDAAARRRARAPTGGRRS